MGLIFPCDFQVVIGGGQDAADVTTTSSRAGKFEAKFYSKVVFFSYPFLGRVDSQTFFLRCWKRKLEELKAISDQ